MKNLDNLIREINEEIKASGVSDPTLKKVMYDFATEYKKMPSGDPACASQDSAAIHFLTEIFHEDSNAMKVYLDFYNAAKVNEVAYKDINL